MPPLSLLFSSDQETTRQLRQALYELEFDVEHCTEIFAAVEKLTTKTFDVIVADWDDGLEASFLLKTSRELKLNRAALGVAIANDLEAGVAARQIGAAVVIKKPFTAEQAKYALLTSDEFLRSMRNWLSKLHLETQTPGHVTQVGPGSLSANSSETFSAPGRSSQGPAAADHKSGEGMALWPYFGKSRPAKAKGRHRSSIVLALGAIGTGLLSVGYVFSQPIRSEVVASSMAKICERALETTHSWLRRPGEDRKSPSELAQNANDRSPRAVTRIRVTPAKNYAESSATSPLSPPPTLPAKPQLEQEEKTVAAVQIPDSLKTPAPAIRSIAVRVTPTLLGALEPVNLPEDLSQKLLLQKVPPGYPTEALRAGLHGSVVLQACIARDGTIRELKLMHGSLLLGQAAYKAVKQWRYRPYLLNGQAVEAQTYVTVNF